MHIGLIGLGKMGNNMRARLRKAGVEEALKNAVPVPTISAAIFARFVSRQEDSPSMKAVAALRKQFGGHAVRKS